MTKKQPHEFDSIVVGGGFAGLSAAIYLARFNRSVLIIDKGDGRWDSAEMNQNYMGFPSGITSRKLHWQAQKQALGFGAYFQEDCIERVGKEKGVFVVDGQTKTYHAKTVIFATGVKDHYTGIPNFRRYLGKSLFWCITCDGYLTNGKKVLVVGNDDDAVCTTLQFLNFTPHVVFVTNHKKGKLDISPLWKRRLLHYRIPIVEGYITSIEGDEGLIKSVTIDNQEIIQTDMVFNQQGASPNSELAVELGVKVNRHGYILTDSEQRTNLPHVYAAGDVTKLFSHQIVTAAHEGSMAAQAANYDLYNPSQRFPDPD